MWPFQKIKIFLLLSNQLVTEFFGVGRCGWIIDWCRKVDCVGNERVLTRSNDNVQPGEGVTTPDGNGKCSRNGLKTGAPDRATALAIGTNDKVDACEKVIADRTTVERLKYYGNSVEDSIRESKEVEEQMPPAAQPARDPLAGIHLLSGEHPDIRIDVRNLLANADEWLTTPNTNFGGRSPLDLIGTVDEHLLRETLRSVIYSGMA